MIPPDLLIRATIWLSLASWAAGELLLSGVRRPSQARLAWSIGALALAVHLAFAMHFKHDWSHAAAVADTARQTAGKFGMNWGGGVWFNYALAAWWLLDAAWAWRSPGSWAGVSRWRTARRGFFLFMWFNGAVVFPTGPVRWVGLALCLLVAAAWWRDRRPDAAQPPASAVP